MTDLSKYEIAGDWNGIPIYKIPVVDCLGVRSAIYTRRMGSYSYFIKKILNGLYDRNIPMLCFIAGDGMIRIKHGNVVYWAARETERVTHLYCIFPGGPKETDELLPEILEDLGIKLGGFC